MIYHLKIEIEYSLIKKLQIFWRSILCFRSTTQNLAFRSGHLQNPSALGPGDAQTLAVAPSPSKTPPYHGRRDSRGGRTRDPAAATAVQASSAERAACGGAPRRAPPSAPRHRHGGDLRHRAAPGGLGPGPSPIQDRRKQTQLAPHPAFAAIVRRC